MPRLAPEIADKLAPALQWDAQAADCETHQFSRGPHTIQVEPAPAPSVTLFVPAPFGFFGLTVSFGSIVSFGSTVPFGLTVDPPGGPAGGEGGGAGVTVVGVVVAEDTVDVATVDAAGDDVDGSSTSTQY